MINHPQWLPIDVGNIREKQVVIKKTRLSRRQFAGRLVACLCLAVLLVAVNLNLTLLLNSSGLVMLLASLLSFGMLLFVAGVLVWSVIMRLHDANMSAGFTIALLFFPIGSFFVLTFCLIKPGTEGDNYFGIDPRLSAC